MPDIVTAKVTLTPRVARVTARAGGPRGPQGPQGPPGPPAGADRVFTAGATVQAYRLAALSGADRVVHADPANAAHAGRVVGFFAQSATADAPVTVRRLGEIANAGWAFTPGATLFLGADGTLTPSPAAPGAAFNQAVALAVTATTVLVDLDEPVLT